MNAKRLPLGGHLVQLSFGDGVQRRVAGEEVFLHKYMVPMAMSFSARHGWPILQQPLSVCSAQLSQHINTNAFAELVSREHSSARFLCHEDSVEPLLRASGSEGVFFKVRKVEPVHVLSDLELLWLPEQTTLDMARALAQHDHVLGVCAKGGAQQPRLALRFKTVERMAAFAKENDIEDVSRLQRWKVVGLPISIGLHGLMVLFKDLAWELHSVLYFESDHAMVLAEKLGEHTLKYYTEGKQKHQIVFKALNASAKAAARTASQAAAA